MDAHEKEQLLKEIGDSDGTRASVNPLDGLMHRWLVCQNAQAASQLFALALSALGQGDAMWPGLGIWPLPPG